MSEIVEPVRAIAEAILALMAVANFFYTHKLEKSVNSMKDAQIASAKVESKAVGHEEGFIAGTEAELTKTATAQVNFDAGVQAEKAREVEAQSKDKGV